MGSTFWERQYLFVCKLNENFQAFQKDIQIR